MEDDTPGGSVNELSRLGGRVLADRYRIENVVSTGANTIITEAVDVESGAAVTVFVTTSSGKVTSVSATTDATGKAVLSYKVNTRDGIGTYSAKATVAKAGYTSTSVTSTFPVK